MKRAAVLPLACLSLTACSGWQSALDPHSGEARHLADLFWFFATVNTVVWLLVAGALLYTLRRRGGNYEPTEDSRIAARRKTRIVAGLVAATVVILTLFTLLSFYATRGFAWQDMQTLTIEVTGRQWWWDIQYHNDDPHQIFETANEIHIPAGRPVTLELEGGDVIHSFWVPNLMGKQDLIPGRKNFLTIRADKPGLYRGQCAEFAGWSMPIWRSWSSPRIKRASMPGASSS